MMEVHKPTPLHLAGINIPGYEVVRQIGAGGMGAVFAARREADGADVAIKLVPTNADEIVLKRFDVEARIGHRLQHPDIVQVYEAGRSGDHAYLVMEHLRGCDLSRAIDDRRFGFEERLTVVARVARALEHAHADGVFHRDIKPANIFVTSEGDVRLLDFGVAKVTDVKLTKTGNLVGTPSYMAPELVTGSTVDGRADVFSLGVLAFELMTSELPWVGETAHAVLMKICVAPPEAFSAAFERWGWPDVNAPVVNLLDRVIHRAIAAEPERRFQNMQDFANAIEEVVATHLHDDPSEVTREVEQSPDVWLNRKLDWAKARAARMVAEESADLETMSIKPVPPLLVETKDSSVAVWVGLVLFFLLALGVTAYLFLEGA